MTNIPNLLTFFRILLIPVFVILFYLPYQWSYLAAALVFILAAARSPPKTSSAIPNRLT